MTTLVRFVLPTAIAIGGALALPAPSAPAQMLQDEPAARPGVDPEAQRLVAQMKAAWNEVQALSTRVNLGGTGGMGAFFAKTDAELLARRVEGEWVVRATGNGKMAAVKKEADFDVLWDRRTTTWVDDEERTVTTAVNGSGFAHQMADASRPLGLFGESPFEAIENAHTLTLGDPSQVDGVACDTFTFVEMKVDQPGAPGATYRWHVGQQDHLPRRIEQIVDSGALTGSIVWTLNALRAEASLPDSAFVIRPPAGYEVKGLKPFLNRRVDDGSPPDPNAPRGDPRFNQGEIPERNLATKTAPDFELTTLDGEAVRLSDYRGKHVLLDFWGTWCLPCKKESPLIQELHEDYADKGLVILALAFRSPDEQVAKYFDDNKYTYTPLLNAEGAVKDYRVRAFPTYVLIGPRGQEIERFSGGEPEAKFATMRKMIDRFIEAGAQ